MRTKDELFRAAQREVAARRQRAAKGVPQIRRVVAEHLQFAARIVRVAL